MIRIKNTTLIQISYKIMPESNNLTTASKENKTGMEKGRSGELKGRGRAGEGQGKGRGRAGEGQGKGRGRSAGERGGGLGGVRSLGIQVAHRWF